ncbi:hypothetical protein [Curtobacterium sp. NPDC086286]|uniref:hypothetical protein n=1 Tax=Curtobacterium sp. NPDC086286 TaxID=3363964 RepID=UPI003825FE2D
MSTSTNRDTDDRDRALRALLVDTVEHTPRRRRRWRAATIAGAVVCVLGGAAAGGAITAAASPDPAALKAQSQAATVVGGSGATYLRVVGSPVGRVGSSDETISVGRAPARADTFTWVATCRTGNGEITERGSGVEGGKASCAAGSHVTGSYAASEIAGHRIRLSVDGDLGWTLSYGWLRTPPMPAASAAQDQATEDGVVTRSEYLAAFDRLQGCMTARGESLGRIPRSSLFVAPTAHDASVLDWCSASEWSAVDVLWQNEHPAPASDDDSWGWQPYDPASDPRYAG